MYFIHDAVSKAVKIGYSDSPEARKSDLQTANPNELVLMGYIPGSRSDEKTLHGFFAPWRMRGEWFKATEEVLEKIEQIISARGIRRQPAGEMIYWEEGDILLCDITEVLERTNFLWTIICTSMKMYRFPDDPRTFMSAEDLIAYHDEEAAYSSSKRRREECAELAAMGRQRLEEARKKYRTT